MKTKNSDSIEIDLHRLELRYADTRVSSPTVLNRLFKSIEQQGQVVPVTVVVDKQQMVLIDGYLRVHALQRSGRDMVQVICWECSLVQALLDTLAHEQTRGWEAFEEANILQVLCDDGLSQREIARQVGRDVSWVNRRLQLLEGMSEEIKYAVRRGELSIWSATRVLMPLARANSAHANFLLAAIKKESISTRVLNELYKQYNRSTKATREHLVRNPQLFDKALKTKREVQAAKRTKKGPEGQWTETLIWVGQRLNQLIRQVPLLFPENLENSQRDDLLASYQKTQHAWQQLEQILAFNLNPSIDIGVNNDIRGKRANNTQTSSAGNSATRDLSHTQSLPQHSAPHATK